LISSLKNISNYRKSIFVFLIIFLSAAYLIFHYPRPLFHKPLSLIAFDRNQNLLGARIASDGQWRISTSDTIPPKYIKALIQAEDHRFYYHIGIDPLALISTLRDHFFKHKKIRGASTIPMQIMRMALGNQDRTFSSKIQEAIYAVYLSVTSSKQKQLSYYANNAPFGGNVVGIEAACWRYYGKSPHLISWAEAAVLALLPNAPSLITLSKNKALLMKKRNRLLRKMLINKILTREEYDLALLEPLPDSFTEIPLDNQHLLTHLDKQPSKTKRFETTIDLDIQNMCREIAEYHLDALTASNINNIAIIVLDNPTGNVLSYIGNTQKQVSGNAVNMITAKRSSGSLLKPLLVTSLFDQGYYSNYSLVHDAPIHIN
jgi:penicillin-binding protein 1C